MIDTQQPSCTSYKTFRLWVEAARMTGNVRSFCTDCLPVFKAKSSACGKCDHPEIRFREDEDGFVEGFAERKQEAKKLAARGTSDHLASHREERAAMQRHEKQMREHKIVLSLHRGPMTASDIVRKTGIKEGAVYRLLKDLLANGLVMEFKKQYGGAKLYKVGMVV